MEEHIKKEKRLVGKMESEPSTVYSSIIYSINKRLQKETLSQLIKYVGVGGSAALIEWSIFAISFFVFNFHYFLGVVISFVFATFANYFMSVKYVFTSGKYTKYKKIILLYFVSFIGLIFNLVLMWLLFSQFEFPSMASKIMATGCVFMWNFLLRKYWVFKY
jgi:putative flippase GtrA